MSQSQSHPEEQPFQSRQGDYPAIRDLANLVMEDFHLHATSKDDFEMYAYQLQAHFYHNPEHFRQRFIQGYECLIYALREWREGEGDQGPFNSSFDE